MMRRGGQGVDHAALEAVGQTSRCEEGIAASLLTRALVRGDLKQAEGHFVRMIAIYEKVYAGKHYLIGIAKSNLASVFMRREEWVRAEALFRESLTVYTQTLPPGHINEGIGRIKLGRTLLRQKKYAEAQVEIQRGQDIVSKQAKPSVSWLENARKDLAEIAARHQP